MGGLSRRAHIINKVKQEESKPVLVLDAGAMLFPQPRIPSSLFTAQSTQAEGVIEAMDKMGYDAFGLAPHDLAAGKDFILNQSTVKKLPWLSMNLVSNDQQLLFPPYLIKTVGDLSVCVMSITGNAQSTSKQGMPESYQTLSWEKSLQDILTAIRGKTDMNILLSSLPEKTNKEIAKKYQDIHLIIQSGQTKVNKRAQLYENTLITQIASRGKYMGRLDIRWGAGQKWHSDSSSQTKQTKDRLDRIKWQIGRLEKRLPHPQIK